jgi:hypothetical protein
MHVNAATAAKDGFHGVPWNPERKTPGGGDEKDIPTRVQPPVSGDDSS